MKKLALMIVLALVASRLLSNDGGRARGPRWTTDEASPRVATPTRPASPEPARKVSRAKLHRLTPAPKPAQDPAPASPKVRQPAPGWYPKTEAEEEAAARPDEGGFRVLVGQVSISEDRARLDLRKRLDREVRDWLAADVAPSWTPPADLVNAMVLASTVQPSTRSLKPATPEATATADLKGLDDLYTFYRAAQKLDFSSDRRARFVEAYRQDLAVKRTQRLGAGVILALVALALFSTYIKTDEATKGYYTNRLRLLAAAGLGGAGVLVYRLLG